MNLIRKKWTFFVDSSHNAIGISQIILHNNLYTRFHIKFVYVIFIIGYIFIYAIVY